MKVIERASPGRSTPPLSLEAGVGILAGTERMMLGTEDDDLNLSMRRAGFYDLGRRKALVDDFIVAVRSRSRNMRDLFVRNSRRLEEYLRAKTCRFVFAPVKSARIYFGPSTGRSLRQLATAVALCFGVGCAGAESSSSRGSARSGHLFGFGSPADSDFTDQDRQILRFLVDSPDPGKHQTGSISVSLGTPYTAASGLKCRETRVLASQARASVRLACLAMDGSRWGFVVPVFPGESGITKRNGDLK